MLLSITKRFYGQQTENGNSPEVNLGLPERPCPAQPLLSPLQQLAQDQWSQMRSWRKQ